MWPAMLGRRCSRCSCANPAIPGARLANAFLSCAVVVAIILLRRETAMKSNCISRGPSPARSIRSSLRTMIFPALIAALPAAEVTVTTALDEDDGVLGGGKGISLREAILYAPDNSVIVFDLGLTC